MNYVYFMVMCIFLTACAPSFEIVNAKDKFSMTNDDSFVGRNNRITTKSTEGGVHVDYKGIYLDPYLTKSPSGVVKDIGFYFSHYNFSVSDGFNPLHSIVFITDRGKVALYFSGYKGDFDVAGYNNITNSYNTTFSEKSECRTTVNDFLSIAESSTLEAKLIGDNRVMVIEKDDILESFMSNMKEFAKLLK